MARGVDEAFGFSGVSRVSGKIVLESVLQGFGKLGDTWTSALLATRSAGARVSDDALKQAKQLDDLQAAGKDVPKKNADDVAKAFAKSIRDQIDTFARGPGGKSIFENADNVKIIDDMAEQISTFIQKGIKPRLLRKELLDKKIYDNLGKAIKAGDEVEIKNWFQRLMKATSDYIGARVTDLVNCLGRLGCFLAMAAIAGVSALFIKARLDTDRKNNYKGLITELKFDASKLTITHSPGESGVHNRDKVYFCGMAEGYEWLEDGETYAITSVERDTRVTITVGEDDEEDEDISREDCKTTSVTRPSNFDNFCESDTKPPTKNYCGLLRFQSDFWANVAKDARDLGKGLADAIGGLFGGLFGGFNFWWILGPVIACVAIIILIFLFNLVRSGKRGG